MSPASVSTSSSVIFSVKDIFCILRRNQWILFSARWSSRFRIRILRWVHCNISGLGFTGESLEVCWYIDTEPGNSMGKGHPQSTNQTAKVIIRPWVLCPTPAVLGYPFRNVICTKLQAFHVVNRSSQA